MADQDRFPRRPGAAARSTSDNKYERMLDEEAERAAQGAMLQDRDPAAVLRSRQIAREIGVNPQLVEDDQETFEAAYWQRKNRETIRDNPWMAKWLSNPDNAAAARDDVEPLSNITRTIDDPNWLKNFHRGFKSNNLGETAIGSTILPALGMSKPEVPEWRKPLSEQSLSAITARAQSQPAGPEANPLTVARGLGASVVGTVLNTGLGGVDFVADALGVGDNPEFRDYIGERAAELETFRRENTPDIDNFIGSAVYSGAESVANLGAMATLGGANTVLALFGITTGLSDYTRFRQRGASSNEALLGGTGTGSLETATEYWATKLLLGRFGGAGVGSLVGGYLAREVPGEWAATITQGAIDTAITGSSRTWEQWVADLPEELAHTTIATLAMGGMVGGASVLARAVRPEMRSLEEQARATTDMRFLDQLMEQAQQPKMRALDPESFRQFVADKTDGTPVQNLYLPVEAVVEYMQSEGYEPGVFEAYQEQIAEAQATQGDVVIPVADAAARLAGTPAWDALREQVRVQPGGMSMREATERSEEIMASLEERGKAIAEEAATEDGVQTERAALYEETKNQLLAAGMPTAQAEANAQLWAASRDTWAQELGVTIREYMEANPVRLPGAPTAQVEEAARTFAQMAAANSNERNVIPHSEAHRRQIVDSNRMASTLYSAWERGSLPAHFEARLGEILEDQERAFAAGEIPDDLKKEAEGTLAFLRAMRGEQNTRTMFQADDPFQDLIEHVPGFGKIAPFLADDERAKLRKKSAEKITQLVESFPDAEEMASVAFSGQAKRGWYERSALALLDVFGVADAPRFAALLAATSPQNSVEMNAINALNIWTNWTNAGRPTDPKTIKKIMGQSVVGNKGEGSVLDAWVNNTYRALSADNPADITLSGPKVNSFMLNLIGVTDEVTNDAWMANYALMDAKNFQGTPRKIEGDKVLSKSPGYIAFSAVVRRAADILTKRTGQLWTASEVQETVWSWTKTVTESRAASGNQTVEMLLEAGSIVDADIAATPDFAMLFQQGIYRRILENGGYAEEIENLERSDRGDARRSGGARPITDAEGAGVDPATFRQHLYTAGARIEERVAEQLAGSGKGSALAKARKRGNTAQLDLFANYQMTPLEGLLTPVKVDGVLVDFGPFAPAREAARRYALRHSLPHNPPTDYVKVDVERAERIAAEFEAMEHNPNDPEVKAAYRAMIDETIAQWRMIKETGLQVDFITGDDPYGNPRNAIIDVVENNHLWVYPTDAGFGGSASADVDVSDNPLLEIVPGEKINGKPVRANDIFRIVHDYFGHIKEGVGFRADGEENAWRIHSAMYSPLARRAMTTETRGQNSWVNFGPFGEKNRTASGAETEYAPQKIGLLPEWVSEEGSGQPRTFNQDVMTNDAGWTEERVGALIQDYGYSFNDESKAFAAMISPDQFLGLTADASARAMIEERLDTQPGYARGELREDRLAESLPIHLTVEFGKHRSFVMGHEGRHRMTMLKRQGVTQVPVVIRVQNGKATEDREIAELMPQSSRLGPSGDTPAALTNLIPITWKNRDRLLDLGGRDPRVLFQQGEGAIFYSALTKAVEESKTAKAPAAQWIATLRKAPGVKQEELEWTGLIEFLEMQEGAVTRDQLLELLRGGGIVVDEVVLGRPLEERLGDYGFTLDDLSSGEAPDDALLISEDTSQEGQFHTWSSDPSNDTYRELLITLPIGEGNNPQRAPSTHWDVESVVAHARFMEKTDADGKRVLFIEEVQSDWHQKGRDEGYAQPPSPEQVAAADAAFEEADRAYAEASNAFADDAAARLREMIAEADAKGDQTRALQLEEALEEIGEGGGIARAQGAAGAVNQFNMAGVTGDTFRAFNAARLRMQETRTALRNMQSPIGVPEAPFKSTWPAFVMKRMIRYAVDHGFERVAWTTGEEQAERYNLSQAVGSLAHEGMQDGEGHRIRMGYQAAQQLERNGMGRVVETGGRSAALRMTEGQMREAFGNEITQRLLDSDGETLSDNDLRVGGEGMKAFYDRNLVNITNDIVKKYGTKVGPVEVAMAPQGRNLNVYENGLQTNRTALQNAEAEGDQTEVERRREWIAALEEKIEKAKAGNPASHPGFDITDKMRDAARQGFTLFQQPKAPRGSSTFYEDGSATIQLFATANPSTLIHEMSHVWLEELQRHATAKGASKRVKEDWAKVKSWFAAQGHPVRGDVIPVEAHELFARGGERYTMEGRAPSAELAGAFSRFRAWLLRIYQVVENLRSPITPEIRDVFDRLLATQEAIDQYREQEQVRPLFKTAEEAQMTEAEFAAYTETIGAARNEAYDALLFKTMEAIRRRENQKMRDQRSNIRAEVAAEINARPEFIALHLLRTGRWLGDPDRETMDIKLNTGWLIDTYGEDVLDQLPRGLPISRGDGVDGDQVAEIVGMPSGDALVKSLILMRSASEELKESGERRSLRDKMIEEQVDRVMAERHGDPLLDGTIEEEAIAAINTARQGEIISGEIRQLAKRKATLGGPTPYQFAREWAKRKIAAGRVSDVASRSALQRYIRGTAKAQRLAEKAILEDDADEAFRQKQAQLLNHALLAEAKVAADEIDAIVARLNKLGKRAAMKSVDQDYMDRIHEMLEKYDFRPRSQRSIDEADSFAAWAADQRAKGFEVHVPPRMQDRAEHYSRVTVEELLGLNDMVASLLHLGRTKQKIKDAQGERDFNEFRDEVLARINNLPTRKLPEKPINEEERRGAGLASELLKVETIVEELDGGKTGPLHDVIVLGSTKAANLRDRLRDTVLIPIAKTYKDLTRAQWRRLEEKVTIPELTWNTLNEGDPRLGSPVTITRSELLTIFLNMGNLSNLEKMSKGERWPVATLRAVIAREFKKEDYDLAQTLWDQVGSLWPDIVRVERGLSGVVPEQVENMPVETPFGTYQGGYWPMVYDSARSQRAEDNEGKRVDDMFGMKSGLSTQKGHTITRTAAVGPVNLSLEKVLFDHIEQVITRVAYAEYARDVMRVIRDKRIRGLIDTKLGPEYRKQIEPWVLRQINEGAVHAKAAKWWQKVLRQTRINMTIAAMGLRVSTGVAQTLGLTASAQRIGAEWVARGIKRSLTNPKAAAEFVDVRSTEIAYRQQHVNRDVAEVFAKLRGKHTALAEAQAWAFWHIGMIDRHAVAIPTWLGAHAKGMDQGMTDAEASAYADKEVRLSQGSGREKDLSAWQSPNNDAMRFFTMFYTPFNVMFNAQWQGVRGLKRGDPRPAMGVAFWWMTASVLADALLSGDLPDTDDDETWAGWFARNVFFGMFASVPLVRDLANYTERKMMGEYASYDTPVSRVALAVEDAGKVGLKLYEGEDVDRPIKKAGDLSAILFGIPTSQIGTTTQYLWDTSSGDVEPETVSDYYFGLTRGKEPEE